MGTYSNAYYTATIGSNHLKTPGGQLSAYPSGSSTINQHLNSSASGGVVYESYDVTAGEDSSDLTVGFPYNINFSAPNGHHHIANYETRWRGLNTSTNTPICTSPYNTLGSGTAYWYPKSNWFQDGGTHISIGMTGLNIAVQWYSQVVVGRGGPASYPVGSSYPAIDIYQGVYHWSLTFQPDVGQTAWGDANPNAGPRYGSNTNYTYPPRANNPSLPSVGDILYFYVPVGGGQCTIYANTFVIGGSNTTYLGHRVFVAGA